MEILSEPSVIARVRSTTGTEQNKSSIEKLCSCFMVPKVSSGRELGVWEASLEDRSGIVSNWMLSYLTPLLRLGSEKVLEADDLGIPSKQDRSEHAYKVASEAWNEQVKKIEPANKKLREEYESNLRVCHTEEERLRIKQPKYKDPSMTVALVNGFGVWKITVAMVYYVIGALLGFVPVLILNDLVKFFESGKSIDEYDAIAHPWVQVAALAVVPIVISILQNRHQTTMIHFATFVRTAVSTMLYKKALTVSAAGRAKTSTGQVVNMMSNDAAQLQRFIQFVGLTSVAPIQIVIALILIFQQVGNATWVGVGFMLFLVPINGVIFGIVSKYRSTALKNSDLRVKVMNEILAGIRIIKFYAWEHPFGKEVGEWRRQELAALTKLAYITDVGFALILLAAPLIQPILVFVTYVAIQDEPMDAATAFTTVALFNIMRFPFAFFPLGLLQYVQSRISLRRLERYLDLPELSHYVDKSCGSDDEEGSITIESGTFCWFDPNAKAIRPVHEEKVRTKDNEQKKGDKKSVDEKVEGSTHSAASSDTTGTRKNKIPTPTLQDLTVHIPAGSLVAVIGTVGSGKSSFLAALLGELEPINGSKVRLPHSPNAPSGFVTYCAQTPWVVNDTLRGNVLFGRPFDKDRYDRVVQACALNDDLAVLPAGDMTEIGERGINLSGGQRARVSLARALYSESTRVTLLDDPLSAVDANVAEHIFSEAIAGGLAQGLTRILVTHQVHLLSRCDSVIVMENGRIKHHGSYNDLMAKGMKFAGAIDLSRTKKSATFGKTAADDESATSTDNSNKNKILWEEKNDQLAKHGKNLVEDEERGKGSVAGSAYTNYAKAGGVCTAIAAVAMQGMGRLSEIMASFWLALWSDESIDAENEGFPLTTSETNYYVGIYALFGLLGVVGLALRGLAIAMHRLRASKLLHDNLTESILRAPISFFDVTPTGRILNRFAADMDKVDLELTQNLSQGISTIFNVLGAMGAIVAATKGTFIIPMIPLSYLYYLIQKWFRKTSTELQRINSIANSPIFTDFSQTLTGTSTIRAYGEEGRFFQQCQSSFDNQNVSYILVNLVGYWLGLRLDILGAFIVAFIGGVALATYKSEFIPAGWVGLALAYGIEVTNYLKFGVKMIATIEAQMNSVERILYYTRNIDPEAPAYIPENDPPAGKWPNQGVIEIQNASMRYRDGPLVLKDISVRVDGGEKIGVCGRTGSGKSSLMAVLFRISEIEDDGGKLLIDGVDTGKIGTAALRLNLSIIPQDPVIFSNTVRYNLDPFGTCSDDELWEVLRKVHMSEVVEGLQNGLEEQMAEGGENFSQGQRQLLCIARALLRKPKVLVMDEATASMDNTTDASIQEMIRENFADATVLTIAHRLNTIMDSDRILVLDDGHVAEYDTPEVLLEKEDGIFRSMIEKSRAEQSKDR